MSTLKCLVLMAFVACAYGAAYYNTGSCPPGRSVGERWRLADSCVECSCDQNGYGCTGCGVVNPQVGCYIMADKSAVYPECCPSLMCPPVFP